MSESTCSGLAKCHDFDVSDTQPRLWANTICSGHFNILLLLPEITGSIRSKALFVFSMSGVAQFSSELDKSGKLIKISRKNQHRKSCALIISSHARPVRAP